MKPRSYAHLAAAVAGLFAASLASATAWADVSYTITDLGLGSANGINASGQVVGFSGTLGSDMRAFLYSGSTMTDLGTLNGTQSSAEGINDSGQVVGSAFERAWWVNPQAFLYSGSTMSDLGTLGGA